MRDQFFDPMKNQPIPHEPRQFVQHVRHPSNPSRYVGTVAVVLDRGKVCVGWSQCHPSDDFNKKVGRQKALGRAYSTNPPTNIKGYFYNPARVLVGYRNDGTKIKVDPITPVKTALLKKARRIWFGEPTGEVVG